MTHISCAGLKFWKIGNRRIFAVTESEIGKGKGNIKMKEVVNVESESDDEMPAKKTRESPVIVEVKAI